jgi:excisionase family DNA binding protein
MQPICISVPAAMRALGIGRTKIYQLINTNQLRVVRIGRRTLISTASIRTLAGERSPSGS